MYIGELFYFISQARSQEFKLFPGLNVTDRIDDWTQNYRCPDLVALAAKHSATIFEMGIIGGPDFLAEVVLPYDHAREKLPFYEKIGTRECLYIDIEVETLELYRLKTNKLKLMSSSTSQNGIECVSEILKLSIRMISEEAGCIVEVRFLDDPTQVARLEMYI